MNDAPPHASLNHELSRHDAQIDELTVLAEQAGQRLDKWLSLRLPDQSRAFWQRAVESGQVQRLSPHGWQVVTDTSRKLLAGDCYRLNLPAAPSPISTLTPIDDPLTVLFEDDYVLVLDKPAGLVTHPGAGSHSATLVQLLLAHTGGQLASVGAPLRPGIVHRLDKGTSGVMVVAKTDAAHHHLAKQFSVHSIERAYQAVVWGCPSPSRGTVTAAIGRSDHNRQKMAVLNGRGKPAVTHYQLLQALQGGMAALVRCQLETGRTHQIRVHLTSLGHPLIGDSTYGGAFRHKKLPTTMSNEAALALRTLLQDFDRPALHAMQLGFVHPISGDLMRFESPPPADFVHLLETLANPHRTAQQHP
ncbi:MAG: RluA family pseudouridine synthase [Alphaproteobacteria bacterium]|nr:RluA family pseudouridine synthase [Alphaproteobacteria bacterium]